MLALGLFTHRSFGLNHLFALRWFTARLRTHLRVSVDGVQRIFHIVRQGEDCINDYCSAWYGVYVYTDYGCHFWVERIDRAVVIAYTRRSIQWRLVHYSLFGIYVKVIWSMLVSIARGSPRAHVLQRHATRRGTICSVPELGNNCTRVRGSTAVSKKRAVPDGLDDGLP